MGKAAEHGQTFSSLSDVERWKFLRGLRRTDYIVMIDNNCTFVMFSDDEEDTVVDFDFCIGNTYGVKHLLTLLNINFKED